MDQAQAGVGDLRPPSGNGKAVKVHVVYCSAWGYSRRFRHISQQLVEEFGTRVEVTGEETQGEYTGYLEVTVNGKLVHSKDKGDGFVDNQIKMGKIKESVQAAFKA